jgi:hypothetical protein
MVSAAYQNASELAQLGLVPLLEALPTERAWAKNGDHSVGSDRFRSVQIGLDGVRLAAEAGTNGLPIELEGWTSYASN